MTLHPDQLFVAGEPAVRVVDATPSQFEDWRNAWVREQRALPRERRIVIKRIHGHHVAHEDHWQEHLGVAFGLTPGSAGEELHERLARDVQPSARVLLMIGSAAALLGEAQAGPRALQLMQQFLRSHQVAPSHQGAPSDPPRAVVLLQEHRAGVSALQARLGAAGVRYARVDVPARAGSSAPRR